VPRRRIDEAAKTGGKTARVGAHEGASLAVTILIFGSTAAPNKF
jgi:hypothetical protein